MTLNNLPKTKENKEKVKPIQVPVIPVKSPKPGGQKIEEIIPDLVVLYNLAKL